MKQIIQNFRSGLVSVQDIPAPTVHTGGLIVANRVSLISIGTEKSTVQVAQRSLAGKAWERPDLAKKVLNKVQKDGLFPTMKMVWNRLDSPAALGYSCAGIALEVGEDVKNFSPGDRVACAGQNYASHAELIFVPKNLCVKIPENVDFEEAAFVTLGAIALQGVRRAEPHLGERVAVIGLGLLGQLTVQLLKAAGCAVVASDLDVRKMECARNMGADVVAHPIQLLEAAMAFSRDRGVDAVILTAGTPDNGPVEMAGHIARKKGRVVVVGAVGMNIPREDYYKKELDLRLSTSYGPGRYDPVYEETGVDYPFGYVRWTENRNMEAFLSLIQQKKVDVRPLVTHRFSLQEVPRAYDAMVKGNGSFMGALILYDHSEESHTIRKIDVAPCRSFDRLRFGIVGAGNHVKDVLIPALSHMRTVRLQAICTQNGMKAKTLAEKVRASYCTTDAQEIFQDPDIDAVVIGTPHSSHATLIIQALQAGKHVFTEKPLCLTHQELDQIVEMYQTQSRLGLSIVVGFNRRFSQHSHKAKEFFRDRRNPLVMIYRINAGAIPQDHWIQRPDVGGGRILGEICHFVDYLQFLCGAPPVSVYARKIGDHSSGISDDQCVLSLSFADGSVGTIVYSSGGDPALAKERIEVFGDGKALVLDDFSVLETFAQGKSSAWKSGRRDKGFPQELEAFVSMLTKGEASPIPFQDSVMATKTCLLAVDSLLTGRPFSIPG